MALVSSAKKIQHMYISILCMCEDTALRETTRQHEKKRKEITRINPINV